MFLPGYNGISMMAVEEWYKPDEIFATDACLDGCGAFFQRRFFQSRFPVFIRERQLHINALAMLALVVSLKVWSPWLKGKRIVVYCDNQATVNILNKGSSRDLFIRRLISLNVLSFV